MTDARTIGPGEGPDVVATLDRRPDQQTDR